MATKKAVAVKKKAAKQELMSPADMENLYAAQMEKEAGKLPAGTGNMLGIKGGSFKHKGADLGTELEVVILGFVFKNTWYGGMPFNEKEPTIPSCYAIAENEEDLAPHEDAPEPQHEDCATCEFNQFGSDERGTGKACKNTRLLALVAVADLENKPEDIEIVLLSVAPTGLKNFNKYTKGLHKVIKRPLNGVITKLSFDEEADYEMLKFEPVAKVESPATAKLLLQLTEDAQEMLTQPYDTVNYVKLEDRRRKKGSTVARAGGGGGRSRRAAVAKEAVKTKAKSKFTR